MRWIQFNFDNMNFWKLSWILRMDFVQIIKNQPSWINLYVFLHYAGSRRKIQRQMPIGDIQAQKTLTST